MEGEKEKVLPHPVEPRATTATLPPVLVCWLFFFFAFFSSRLVLGVWWVLGGVSFLGGADMIWWDRAKLWMMTCYVGWGLPLMRLSQVARLVCIVVGDQ